MKIYQIFVKYNQNSLGFHAGECRAFVVDGQQVGLVRPDVMKELLNHPQVNILSFALIYRRKDFILKINIFIF